MRDRPNFNIISLIRPKIIGKWEVFKSVSYQSNSTYFNSTLAQVGFNGYVSDLVKNPPNTYPHFNGTFDAHSITGAPLNSDLFLSFGLYDFDKSPFIGHIININVWDRTMESNGKK